MAASRRLQKVIAITSDRSNFLELDVCGSLLVAMCLSFSFCFFPSIDLSSVIYIYAQSNHFTRHWFYPLLANRSYKILENLGWSHFGRFKLMNIICWFGKVLLYLWVSKLANWIAIFNKKLSRLLLSYFYSHFPKVFLILLIIFCFNPK